MKGRAGTEPDGICGDCFYVLGMYDDPVYGLSSAELRDRIAGETISRPVPPAAQVGHALRVGLARRKLVERVLPGRWRVSAYGKQMLAIWCGDDADECARVPCGLGWPA